MRFASLKVESFQSIRHAAIDFIPGLNVIYGPNDLGKSTLVAAVRAALLVVPNSTEAQKYDSWHSDDSPRVELTFIDHEGHYWRVRKTFASSPSAELFHSKDGRTFAVDCKARQVEEKLRTMLGWGIPPPGGKGAPRGALDSFLGNVLLAEQTKTDAIFECSLVTDRDETGKVRLLRALAALAQDPLFKEVLATAQQEVDQYFTQTGRRKRGQSSKFTAASDYVKKLEDDLQRLRNELEESIAIENDLQERREQRTRAMERLHEARTRLEWVEAAGRLRTAQQALKEIDDEFRRLADSNAVVKALEERLSLKERELEAAQAECEVAEAAVRTAEEAYRYATSDDVAREQELRKTKLGAAFAELSRQIGEAERHTERIDAAIAAREGVIKERHAVKIAEMAVESAIYERDRLAEAVRTGVAEVEVTRAVVAFTRWRQAVKAAEEANRARTEAADALASADTDDAKATLIEREIASAEELLRGQYARLPDAAQLETMERLQRELEIAEAALGGGMSVSVRPAPSVTVRTRADRAEIVEINVARQVEADRTMELAVSDVVEIEILAGGVEKRAAVERLRRKWDDEVSPLIAAAGATDLAGLRTLRENASDAESQLLDRRREAEALRANARGLRERASLLEKTASAARTSAGEVEQRRSALGQHEPADLERHFVKLGNPSEVEAESRHEVAQRQQTKIEKDLAVAEQKAESARSELADSRNRLSETELRFGETLAAVGLQENDLTTAASECVTAIDRLSRNRAEITNELEALNVNADRAVEEADRMLQNAKAAYSAAQQNRDGVVMARDALRSEHDTQRGARDVIRDAVAKRDRNVAVALVETCEREMASLASGSPTGTWDLDSVKRDLDVAQHNYDRAKEELDRKEGALALVGGNALREDIARLDEAYDAARIRERELEIDADAWKLLHETLRAVENEEGVHLGRALAGPVADRLGELTGGRYANLRMDTGLKTQSIEVTGANVPGEIVLEGLSVGTRDQLSVLIRLTIADQLRSAIVLDDHLVHSDSTRLTWFRDVLQRTAINAQVIVLTCRVHDYVAADELPTDGVMRDLDAGTIRVIDASRAIARYI